MKIEVAYALLNDQRIISLEIEPGTSPREAIKQSHIVEAFPEIDADSCDIGIFGKAIGAEFELNEGDRIEIYRPLIADPKLVRKQRAEQGLKMKKGGGKA